MCLFLPSGYYYDLDDSYDESDEEEVRAHLRCVAEQPPLKLDTSSEVQVLLNSCMLWASWAVGPHFGALVSAPLWPAWLQFRLCTRGTPGAVRAYWRL